MTAPRGNSKPSMNSSPQLQDATRASMSPPYWHPEEVLGLLRPIEAIVATLIHQFPQTDLDGDKTRDLLVSSVDAALIAGHPQAALAPSTLRHALIGRVIRCQPKTGSAGTFSETEEAECGD